MIDDALYGIRKLVRTVFGMAANSVRPAKQNAAAGGQTDEIATVGLLTSESLGTGGRRLDTAGVVPDDVTTESVVQDHRIVVSVNFYRNPPTKAYLRGSTVSADPATYAALDVGGFDIPIDGTNRQIFGLDFSAVVTMADVAAVIQTRLQVALANTRCAWDPDNARFVVTSPTTGQASEVRGAVAPTTDIPDPDPDPIDVSTVLGLTIASGALSVNNRAGIARYSKVAMDRAARCKQVLRKASAVTLMNELGLKFVSASQARDLTALEAGVWESRGQVDLTFAFAHREAEAVETILTVPITIKQQAPGGAVTTRTFEVTP